MFKHILLCIILNRYALVAYGGDGVFDSPRTIIVDGDVFTNSKNILTYFDKITIGNPNLFLFKYLFQTFVSVVISEKQDFFPNTGE